jgi:Fur family peroxide stress response transcriptional regulator
MLTEKQLTGLLRANDYKVTPQRIAIYEYLAGVKDHPTAEIIFNKLRGSYRGLSLGTVYKTLDVFAKLFIIKELNTGEESFRYDADTSDHQHIQCTSCGKVEDLTLKTNDLRQAAAKSSGYQVEGNELYFYGICPECQKKLQKQAKARLN